MIEMKYIAFCEMTQEFLQKPLEERNSYKLKMSQIAQRHGIQVLFWGMPMGVTDHLVCAFEVDGHVKYFKFQREWLNYGTEDVCKDIKTTRTIAVY